MSVTEAEIVAGEAYQVIGALSHCANMFDHPEVQRALDWFSGFEPGITYKDDASILPWPKEELKPNPDIARASSVPETEAVIEEIKRQADNAYVAALNQLEKPVCLGWEYKAKSGKFGESEFEGHKTANQNLGRHFGMYEAVKLLRALYAAPPPVAAPSGEAAEERIAELQYEAGVYQSLYENVINTAGYQKANTIGELAGWQWRPNGATVWRSDATVKWLDEQGDAIEKRPVFTAYPYDNGGDTLYDALESALWEITGWKDKIRAASALLTRTTFQAPSLIASEPKDAGSGEGQELARDEQERAVTLLRTMGYLDGDRSSNQWLGALHAAGYRITRTAPRGAKPGDVE